MLGSGQYHPKNLKSYTHDLETCTCTVVKKKRKLTPRANANKSFPIIMR